MQKIQKTKQALPNTLIIPEIRVTLQRSRLIWKSCKLDHTGLRHWAWHWFSCLKSGESSELSGTGNKHFIFWVAKRLSATQRRICFMGLVLLSLSLVLQPPIPVLLAHFWRTFENNLRYKFPVLLFFRNPYSSKSILRVFLLKHET